MPETDRWLYKPTDEVGFIDPVDWQRAQIAELIAAVDVEISNRAGSDDWLGVVSAWSVVTHFLTHQETE